MKKESPSNRHPLELKAEELRYTCPPEHLKFESTAELEPLQVTIGQDRAVRAVEFGLGMKSFGYHIFAAGIPGTGKKSLIRALVSRIAEKRPVPPDIVYLYNFAEPDRPGTIQVPAGVGCGFKRDMEALVQSLKEELPKAFQSEDYGQQKDRVIQVFQRKRTELIERAQTEARQRELVIKGEGPQIFTIPVRNGKEISPEEFEELPDEEQKRIKQRQQELTEIISSIHRELRDVQQQTQEQLRKLNQGVALMSAGYLLEHLRMKYRDHQAILDYLSDVREDVLENLEDFLQDESQEAASPLAAPAAMKIKAWDRYQVNLVVDNSKREGAPVILESNPNYKNLIGFMEREARMGMLYTDYTMIRAGSILQANGGFLILDVADVLMAPFAWEALKRVIQNGEVKVEEIMEQQGLIGTAGLRPQAVEVSLKVILLGSTDLYYLLFNFDEDFQKLFKIKADFDTVTRREDERLMEYAQYIKRLCEAENLKHFDREAVAAIIEHCSRMVSDQTRLTLRFSEVADLIRESSYWASQNGHALVNREDVNRTIEQKIYRSNLFEARVQEMIDEGSILIQSRGEKIGQINGLSVLQLGDYAFGKPARITVQVSIGDKGLVNIEREAKLSGRIHDKAVLILSGYLYGKYGQNSLLSLNASICFEQSYSGVDGDSASVAELCAILSCLAELPIRQSLAVTGSMNQMGFVQPIGGVNEKVEGFFQTCSAERLTGDQGVVIPRRNAHNLMLNAQVIQAIREGKFHLYAIETADEALEILMGRPSGAQAPDGTYPEGSIHYLVQRRLEEMAEVARAYGQKLLSAKNTQTTQ